MKWKPNLRNLEIREKHIKSPVTPAVIIAFDIFLFALLHEIMGSSNYVEGLNQLPSFILKSRTMEHYLPRVLGSAITFGTIGGLV